MTHDEAEKKAEQAWSAGFIEFTQIDAYSQHLYKEHKNAKKDEITAERP